MVEEARRTGLTTVTAEHYARLADQATIAGATGRLVAVAHRIIEHRLGHYLNPGPGADRQTGLVRVLRDEREGLNQLVQAFGRTPRPGSRAGRGGTGGRRGVV